MGGNLLSNLLFAKKPGYLFEKATRLSTQMGPVAFRPLITQGLALAFLGVQAANCLQFLIAVKFPPKLWKVELMLPANFICSQQGLNLQIIEEPEAKKSCPMK